MTPSELIPREEPQELMETVASSLCAVPRDFISTSLSGNIGRSAQLFSASFQKTNLGWNTEDEDDEYCEAPCNHHPISTKYPMSLDLPHTNDLHKFIRDVSQALKISYPRTRDICDNYDQAHMLFLRWVEDDLDTQSDIGELQSLMRSLRFTADREALTSEEYKIPSEYPQDSLEEILISRRNEFAQKAGNLLLIYYGGRGQMSKEQRCIWYPWLNPPPGSIERPEVDWTSLQERLLTCEGDIVFILDCCYASSTVQGAQPTWKGFKELLAACGGRGKTDGVSDNSFTRAIIRELKKLEGKSISIGGLQATLVENKAIHGLRNTPIRIGLSEEANQFKSLLLVYPHSFHPFASVENLDSTSLDYESRALISIRLRVVANTIQVRDWLPCIQKQGPQDIMDMKLTWTKHVRLEAGFQNGSTLLFFSMPLIVWNVLPYDASYSFIDVIESGNLIDTKRR